MQLAILVMCFTLPHHHCTPLVQSRPVPITSCEHYAARVQFIQRRKNMRIVCKPVNITVLNRRNHY